MKRWRRSTATKQHDMSLLGDQPFFLSLTGEDALGGATGDMGARRKRMHYSWVKGRGNRRWIQQVTPIPIDAQYRQDSSLLRGELERALKERRPSIALWGWLGLRKKAPWTPCTIGPRCVTIHRAGLSFSHATVMRLTAIQLPPVPLGGQVNFGARTRCKRDPTGRRRSVPQLCDP